MRMTSWWVPAKQRVISPAPPWPPGWRHRPVNQGRAAHRLPGSWRAHQNSPFSAHIYELGGGEWGCVWGRAAMPKPCLCYSSWGGSSSRGHASTGHTCPCPRGQPGGITPDLPFHGLVPRHPPLPTAGRDTSPDDNYRVKCQPCSQEHHYPLANLALAIPALSAAF